MRWLQVCENGSTLTLLEVCKDFSEKPAHHTHTLARGIAGKNHRSDVRKDIFRQMCVFFIKDVVRIVDGMLQEKDSESVLDVSAVLIIGWASDTGSLTQVFEQVPSVNGVHWVRILVCIVGHLGECEIEILRMVVDENQKPTFSVLLLAYIVCNSGHLLLAAKHAGSDIEPDLFDCFKKYKIGILAPIIGQADRSHLDSSSQTSFGLVLEPAQFCSKDYSQPLSIGLRIEAYRWRIVFKYQRRFGLTENQF